MKSLFKMAMLGAGLLVFPAYAGTYDAASHSVTYGTGWNLQGRTGGYATTPASVAAAMSASANEMIEVHFKLDAAPSATAVLAGSSTFSWISVTTDGLIQFGNIGSSGLVDVTGSASVADGQWHVATLTIGNGYLVGFLDGEQVGYKGGAITAHTTDVFGIGGMETGSNLASGTVDEVSFWASTPRIQAFTPLTTPYQGIEDGLVALYHLNNEVTDSSETAVSADLSGSSLYFSPYNWASPSDGTKTSINAGAYFKTSFSGNQCSLSFDVDQITTPLSEVSVSVDGMPAQISNVSGEIPCAPSALVNIPVHSLRVSVKSTTETATRWSTNPATRVALVSLHIAPSASFYAPKIYPRTLLFYGDSITEGVRTLGEAQSLDTDRNDNAVEWSAQTAQRLNTEYGIVGFGATGLTVSGSGSVPALTTSWNMIYPGQERSFSTCPDAMIENEGTNDNSQTATAVQAAETTFLQAFSTMCPASKTIVMRPFGGYQWAALQASVASMGSRNISLLDTTGFMNAAMGIDNLGLHPTANNAVNFLAPQVAAAIERIMSVHPTQTFTYH